MTMTAKALVLGLDGVRYDTLREATTPRLEGLAADGFLVPSPLYPDQSPATVSGVGWSSIATGVWPDKHLVADNSLDGNDLASYDDFLTRRAAAGRCTFAGLGWAPLGRIFRDCGQPRTVRDADAEGFEVADEHVVDEACRQLGDVELDAAFVYLGAVDEWGHQVGTGPEYTAALERVDAQVGALLDAVEARPGYADERWLVVGVTDHGHVDGGGHGGQSEVERTSWVVAGGSALAGVAGVVADGVDGDVHVVDLAPTVLGHLGVAVEDAWGVDGRSFLRG